MNYGKKNTLCKGKVKTVNKLVCSCLPVSIVPSPCILRQKKIQSRRGSFHPVSLHTNYFLFVRRLERISELAFDYA